MSGDPLDLDAIEARAKAVPNGWDRWADWQHYQILALVTPTQIDGWAHPEKRADAMERTEAAVEHIVGMDPATTLALVAEVRSLRANWRMVTTALGYGDGITEPQIEHRDFVAECERQFAEASEWRESQRWRDECHEAGHPDDEDCYEHDPVLALVALRAKVAAVEALHWDVEGKCAHCRDCYHDDYLPWPCPTAAALASSPTPSETGEGEHVAREVFTADGIPFVRCSCTSAKSPTSHRWLSEHVPNGGVAELQAVVKRQAEGAKA